LKLELKSLSASLVPRCFDLLRRFVRNAICPGPSTACVGTRASNLEPGDEAVYREKAVNFNSQLKTLYEEFRVEFYIKIKPYIESKITYLLYIF
jgi:hypothetical protein